MTDEPGNAARIPLFPLRTVLFPGGPLPLRIFEPRYVDMIGRCMREGGTFGVVLIREGGETGAVGAVASVGTSARIEDFSQLPDGLLGILARGDRRFRLLQREQQTDGLNVGTVDWLPAADAVPLPAVHAPLAALVEHALPQLGALYAGMTSRLEDADWVGCRLAEILSIGQQRKQQLLEVDDPLERLAQLAPLLGQLASGGGAGSA